jgi:hypothetical protein
MAHFYNPSYLGGKNCCFRLVWAKTIHETPSQWKKEDRYSGAPVFPVTAGSIDRRIVVQASLNEKQDAISKITRRKKARRRGSNSIAPASQGTKP